MPFTQRFETIAIDDVLPIARARKEEGWRFVQLMCAMGQAGVDMIYTYEKDGEIVNSVVPDVMPEDVVPSITGEYLAAFVFENESHDLFDVTIEGIAIDFAGHFYAVAQQAPMTIISPEQKAAREKAAKVAAAKAAKAAKEQKADADAAPQAPADAAGEQAASPQNAAEDDIEAKLAGMDPEKAAKVRAALEAKARKLAAEQGGE